jgi:hypothetical protein
MFLSPNSVMSKARTQVMNRRRSYSQVVPLTATAATTTTTTTTNLFILFLFIPQLHFSSIQTFALPRFAKSLERLQQNLDNSIIAAIFVDSFFSRFSAMGCLLKKRKPSLVSISTQKSCQKTDSVFFLNDCLFL